MFDHDELANRFRRPVPAPATLDLDIRDAYVDLAMMIAHFTPPGREQALALTHLETSCLFMGSSIDRGGRTEARTA